MAKPLLALAGKCTSSGHTRQGCLLSSLLWQGPKKQRHPTASKQAHEAMVQHCVPQTAAPSFQYLLQQSASCQLPPKGSMCHAPSAP